MSKQPEALRLAAWLNEGAWHSMTLGDVEAAGRELRRLHELNAELLEALTTLKAAFIVAVGDKSPFAKCALEPATAAIAKAS